MTNKITWLLTISLIVLAQNSVAMKRQNDAEHSRNKNTFGNFKQSVGSEINEDSLLDVIFLIRCNFFDKKDLKLKYEKYNNLTDNFNIYLNFNFYL